jgi:hypothetical protein
VAAQADWTARAAISTARMVRTMTTRMVRARRTRRTAAATVAMAATRGRGAAARVHGAGRPAGYAARVPSRHDADAHTDVWAPQGQQRPQECNQQ